MAEHNELYIEEPNAGYLDDLANKAFGALESATSFAKNFAWDLLTVDEETINRNEAAGNTGVKGQAGYEIASPETFKYPLNVGQSADQPHSVLFSIIVREGTRASAAGANETQYGCVPEWTRSSVFYTSEATNQNRMKADLGDTLRSVANLLVKVGAGETARRVVSHVGTPFLGQAAAVIGGMYAADKAIETYQPLKSIGLNSGKRRMVGAIELHISQPPVAQYSAEWQNIDTGLVGGLLRNASGISVQDLTSMEGITSALKQAGIPTLRGIARGTIQAAAGITEKVGLTGNVAGAIDVASGNTLNPYKEQGFRSMGFRKFAFVYKFAPKNKTEYYNVMGIIQRFKYHMHPEIDDVNMTLIYPSEFEIQYRYKGKRNQNLYNMSSCALSDVKVTYGNQDSFTTIKNTGGAPAEINLELVFTELEMLTRNRDGQETGVTDNWRNSH